MKDLMIDLETFGNGNNAAICQVGACYFDRVTGEVGDTYISNVDVSTSLKEGFSVDASTIYWWMSQCTEAQKSITEAVKYPVIDVMEDLNQFISKAKCVWSHATFDFVILMNHFKVLNIKPKVHFRSARDLRTLVDLSGITNFRKYNRVGIHHNALDDCLFQVKYTVDCLNNIVRNLDDKSKEM